MATTPSRSYTDLSFTCKVNPIKKDLPVIKDENAIKRSVLNLFSYQKGEKAFDPNFGSNIPNYLFEVFDYATAVAIQDEVTRMVTLYEPRINLEEVVVEPDFNTNEYELAIIYTLPNNAQRFDITFYLESQST